MWKPTELFEDVGIQLLLLPIFLFNDFTVLDDSIRLTLKTEYYPPYVRHLLRLISLATGHSFYMKKKQNENVVHLHCSDNPKLFSLLIQSMDRSEEI
jgi:hypothetical protein